MVLEMKISAVTKLDTDVVYELRHSILYTSLTALWRIELTFSTVDQVIYVVFIYMVCFGIKQLTNLPIYQ